MTKPRLDGRTAVITGGGSGIGRATAQRFAAEGGRIVLTGWTEAKLVACAEEIGDAVVDIVVADLSIEEERVGVLRLARRTLGQVDVLVNAAGVGYSYLSRRPGSMGDVAATSEEDWRHIVDLNLGSVAGMMRLALPDMVAAGRGSIVNISSISGFLGTSAAHAYAAAKAGVISLTRSAAATYGGQGVRANCVAPGYVRTPLAAGALDDFDDGEAARRHTPAGRPADPSEIANGCLFLASDEASYCNGAVLVMDGGASIVQH
jgi:meso-butanediol dehydrogenase/(S,S)-butanediol dehydrogenase/diacetyl reductase